MVFIDEISRNEVFIACITAWFVAQLLKVILTLIFENRVDVSRFVGSGGMPSSHSSIVTSLTTAVGLKRGYSSVEFAISLVLALIVMYDAAGVRRAVGKQAQILNTMIEDIHAHKKDVFTEERLKELVGHTPIEVLAGALLGIIIANIMI
ncbi:divergent PAP2 family protein [Alkalithermobacter paradoxus]|uniref:Divergent PAP2 family protein n=1 Tax=Alkalithermobacter paradoxus TaxID=29349 RepID=A0A1V4IAQ6_9FIRM|nr:divergent PAP2 family protein [[Clostridium] thermoalcaliphilum]